MVKGVAAIVAAQRNIIQRGVQALNLECVDIIEAGEFAIEIGRVTMTMRASVGGSTTVSGKSIVVWRRQRDGGLKIFADIFNSNAPG
jgi:ketosteroid isomerase-like protein